MFLLYMDTFETIISGSLGALTFGRYWHYISMKQNEEHNRKMDESFKIKLNVLFYERLNSYLYGTLTRNDTQFTKVPYGK